MTYPTQMVVHHDRPRAKVSVILLDWGVRESYHSLHYLNRQTIPREEYDLIWVEFYDRKPAELLALVEKSPAPILDKWLVMGYPADVAYHKHRMYNAGIILSQGEICVICDSDAMFEPTFIESIIKAFRDNPASVVHLDEVRNYSKRHYPFNYPPIADVLGEGCVNWTGVTTTGLDNHPDMIHAANYGACMAARRDDLLRIGGADEHIDYLGYICGPYELTFRLANLGRQERWLRDEYIYHVWHPNTSGCNVEPKGPDDGRGVSLRAIELRGNGRVDAYRENPAIKRLRENPREPVSNLLAMLPQEDDGRWQMDIALSNSPPQIVMRDYRGFNIIFYRGGWFGLAVSEGEFDPVKVQNQEYRQCLWTSSREQLLALLPSRGTWMRQRSVDLLRRVPYARQVRALARRLRYLGRSMPMGPLDVLWEDGNPRMAEEGYYGFNILYCGGSWYGHSQDEGAFDVAKVKAGQYQRCIVGSSIEEVRADIQRQFRQLPLQRRMKILAKRALRMA